jgi:RNA polymerase sigma-70 factor (ECF subfamily)
LVERYKDPLIRFTGRYLGEEHEGEDVAQEVFMRVFRHAATFDGKKFSTWVFTMAANLCRNEVRDRKRRPLTMRVLPEPCVAPDLPSLPLDGIGKIFACLPECEREALLLREQAGMDYRAIADAMGVPIGSVRCWIHRGRNKMREALRREMER